MGGFYMGVYGGGLRGGVYMGEYIWEGYIGVGMEVWGVICGGM